MSYLEPFFIPTHHPKLFLKPFNIPIYVTNLDVFFSSNNQPDCKIRWYTVSLLYKLIVSIKSLAETLVYVSSKHFGVY